MKTKLIENYQKTRQKTEDLCRGLLVEDYCIQGMSDVSPPKWHLAHTTWFFEKFILQTHDKYKIFNEKFHYLFNSYYQSAGTLFPRENRGLLSRPAVKDIYQYRSYVNEYLIEKIDKATDKELKEWEGLIQLGIHHEQQHQELLLMDIKYNFFLNPELPVYCSEPVRHTMPQVENSLKFMEIPGGMTSIGYNGDDFCFDNERSIHQVFLPPFKIANRLVTKGEYLAFMEEGGYENPLLWLLDGFTWINNNHIKCPLYWQFAENEWYEFGLYGNQKINNAEPVSHISFYEADAFARWKGCRLPREEEWEYYVLDKQLTPEKGNFAENNRFKPLPASLDDEGQFLGDLWEWTLSAYAPYPGFKPAMGTIGEYNGKFMNNQRVLRGGSFATPVQHIRHSYRNFFQPEKRWQFSGIRLALDA